MLELKNNSAMRTASRHYIHMLNAKLDVADRELSKAKSKVTSASREKLDEWYPPKLFSDNKQELERIDDSIESIIAAGESTRQVALILQKQATEALIKVESKIATVQGSNLDIDEVIDQLLMGLFSMSSAAVFVDKSIDARTDRVQDLLEKQSFSNFNRLLGMRVTQKSLIEAAANSALDEVMWEYVTHVESLESEGEQVPEFGDWCDDHEMISLANVRDAADYILFRDFYEPAEAMIIDTFVDSPDRNIVVGRLDETMRDVAEKIIGKSYEHMIEIGEELDSNTLA